MHWFSYPCVGVGISCFGDGTEITGNGLGTQERDQEGRHLLGRWQIGKKQPKVEDPSLGDETDSPSGVAPYKLDVIK